MTPGVPDAERLRQAHLMGALNGSHQDGLTGLPARPAFDRALRGELARASAYGVRLSLVLIDVDGLRRVNELHGREAGDGVLLRLAALLGGLRASDHIFALGGGRFALLLPNTPHQSAVTVAARAAGNLGGCGLPAGQVHVYFGVAEARSSHPPGLLAAAEAALEDAKSRTSARAA